jgi:glutaconate CoA-transferase subunit B
MPDLTFTAEEMMTVAAARELTNGTVCFVGIGLPSTAANLARRTHAPDCVLVYESGCIGAKPSRLPLSIGDGELAETADTVVSVPEIFHYWLQGGRIDVGFLAAAEIDRAGNINSTVIGPYDSPTVRLPGAGGAPEIAANAREVIVVTRQSRRTFVEHCDFITSTGGRVRTVITDLGILRKTGDDLTLTAVHPGASVD